MAYEYESMTGQHRKAVIDIFNHYVSSSFAAYPEDPVAYEFFDRFLEITRGYPALVVKEETGKPVGFAFLHPYRSGKTFQQAAEITYFILPDHTGKGIGTEVLDRFQLAARELGITSFLANISSHNQPSLDFHLKRGFQECGRFRRIGRKFEKDFDVVWMQLELEAGKK